MVVPPSVTVVGGGLAGMVAALRLAQLGHQVVLYDAIERLGGKAGATQHGADFDEHGYHFFPAWYLNTWQLVDELGIRDRFADAGSFYQLHRGDFPNTLHTLSDLGSVKSFLPNLFGGVLPVPEMFLFLYSNIDLAAQKLRHTPLLDQITTAGFIRAQWYRTDAVAQQHQDLVLKGISEPSYFVSAKTMQKVIWFWFLYPSPMHRILKGDLQQTFIEPLRDRLQHYGVEIRLNRRLTSLTIDTPAEPGRARVARIELVDPATGTKETVDVDQLVLAIPPEQVRTLLGNDALHRAAPQVFSVQRLRSVPMAALNLYLNRRLPGIPRGHVNLIGSKFGLSFIDVSQFWTRYPSGSNTVLNLIASDFASIQTLGADAVLDLLLEDLIEFIPTLSRGDIDHHQLVPNMSEPLFMNDVGIWPFRPKAAAGLPNLFLAGDYCQSWVDLVSMEGAITTGLHAVKALREQAGLPFDERSIRKIDDVSQTIFKILKWALLPVAAVAKLATLRRQTSAEVH